MGEKKGGKRREWYGRERGKEAMRQWNRKKGERNSEIGEACRIERTVEDRGAVVGENEEGEGKYRSRM